MYLCAHVPTLVPFLTVSIRFPGQKSRVENKGKMEKRAENLMTMNANDANDDLTRRQQTRSVSTSDATGADRLLKSSYDGT